MITAIRQRWDEWRNLVDEDALVVAYSPRHGLVVGVFLLVGALLGAHAPILSDVVRFDAVGFGLAVGPAWLVSMALAVAFTRNAAGTTRALVLPVLGAGVVMFEAGCLVSFAGERSAAAIVSLVALTAIAHAGQGLSSPRYPFVFLADAAGVLGALALAPTTLHQTALGIAGTGGTIAGLLLGEVTVQGIRARRDRDRMRNALEAQIAAATLARADELETAVRDARARGHDIRNALMTALINLELLGASFEAENSPAAAEVTKAAQALDLAIRLAMQAPPGSARRELVSVPSAAETVLRGVRGRFPRVRFTLELGDGDPLTAMVEAGEVGFRRILENMLVNAAEGDGARRAKNVAIHVYRNPRTHTTLVRVEDDGPGFARDQLIEPIRGFSTTKPDGTGLGLFIVDNLARASGGWLERANNEGCGAVVTVSLPSEPDHPETVTP